MDVCNGGELSYGELVRNAYRLPENHPVRKAVALTSCCGAPSYRRLTHGCTMPQEYLDEGRAFAYECFRKALGLPPTGDVATGLMQLVFDAVNVGIAEGRRRLLQEQESDRVLQRRQEALEASRRG